MIPEILNLFNLIFRKSWVLGNCLSTKTHPGDFLLDHHYFIKPLWGQDFSKYFILRISKSEENRLKFYFTFWFKLNYLGVIFVQQYFKLFKLCVKLLILRKFFSFRGCFIRECRNRIWNSKWRYEKQSLDFVFKFISWFLIVNRNWKQARESQICRMQIWCQTAMLSIIFDAACAWQSNCGLLLIGRWGSRNFHSPNSSMG